MVNGQYVNRAIFFDDDNDSDNDDDLFVDKNTCGGIIEGAVGFFASDTKKRAVFDVWAGYGNGAFKTLGRDLPLEFSPHRNVHSGLYAAARSSTNFLCSRPLWPEP